MDFRPGLVMTSAVATLVLSACGGPEQSAPSSPSSTGEAVAATATTAGPGVTAERTNQAGDGAGVSASSATPGESAAPTSVEPTSSATETADDASAYPGDSIGYARAFLAAWAAQDDSTVARMAVDVVSHGTDSWAAATGYGEAWSCGMDHLGAEWAGHDLVTAMRPDVGSTDLVVRRSALGGPDAVVGVDHTFAAEMAAPYSRPETVLDAYARQFVEAWMSEDLVTMTRLSDAELANNLLQNYPADPARAPVWAGFQAMEGEPFYLAVQVPTAPEERDFLDIVGMDTATVLGGEPHGVVDTNFIVDPIYSGVCGGGSGPIVTDPAP